MAAKKASEYRSRKMSQGRSERFTWVRSVDISRTELPLAGRCHGGLSYLEGSRI